MNSCLPALLYCKVSLYLQENVQNKLICLLLMAISYVFLPNPASYILGCISGNVCVFFSLFFGGVFVAKHGLSLVAVIRATLRGSAQASHCSGFSCCEAQALGARASVIVARGLSSCSSWALERRLSSCGAQA